MLKISAKDISVKNGKLSNQEVRLIDSEKNNLGVVKLGDAFLKAEQVGLDLVKVSTNGSIPVCKIMDYSAEMYRLQKSKPTSANQIKSKEIKFRLNIGENDYQTKIAQAQKFLQKGLNVKITLIVHGREKGMKDMQTSFLQKTLDLLSEFGSATIHKNKLSATVVPA